jgi:hypothetical protein
MHRSNSHAKAVGRVKRSETHHFARKIKNPPAQKIIL